MAVTIMIKSCNGTIIMCTNVWQVTTVTATKIGWWQRTSLSRTKSQRRPITRRLPSERRRWSTRPWTLYLCNRFAIIFSTSFRVPVACIPLATCVMLGSRRRRTGTTWSKRRHYLIAAFPRQRYRTTTHLATTPSVVPA